jgi:LemA protein
MNSLVILVAVALIAVSIIAIYNSLVRRRNEVDNAWSQIDVQLKRRLDLIPNLVETVKGYASHEKATLDAVIQARNTAMSASSTPHAQATAEAYPDLKANQGFVSLQEELSNTESRIAYARQFYGDGVLAYNTAIQKFPSSIVARVFNFADREYFEAEEAARVTPQVKF